MSGKRIFLGALVLSLGLLAPRIAQAGDCVSFFGWHIGRDCPRSDYSPLHYWVPEAYKVRMYVHPSNLDQYTAGPDAPIEASFNITRYRCRTLPPMPSTPYADPAAYYGRPVIAAE
jgi:hypothetical protein